jgi:stress-induced morphogen
MVSPESLQLLVSRKIPDSRVFVRTFQGADHFEMLVVSPAFAGKSRIAQHRMVYQALGEHLQQHIHALVLKTCTPEQWAQTVNKEQK